MIKRVKLSIQLPILHYLNIHKSFAYESQRNFHFFQSLRLRSIKLLKLPVNHRPPSELTKFHFEFVTRLNKDFMQLR